ncbi:MAG: carbohydrate porin [Synechococcales cyanobacterium T60_A2020_003]|nr:carbohydrate porin [Synechococcales cyanobacterium T60_A2020_003]
MPAPTTPASSTNSFTPINAPILGVSDLESAPLGNLSPSPASSFNPGHLILGQITSVTQLSDVQPTDWAYQALQSLVERYGCIVGYPDSTYRGNNALTRFEFAAGLNACLDRINEIIASGLADVATREDLETVQRLQEEFAAELAMLRGRVDALEARTDELEANQFSTTTKLNGEVIFSIAAASGAYPGAGDPDATPAILSHTDGAPGDDAQFALFQRTRLNLTTSFTGSDLLITGLQSYNYLSDPSSIQGTLGYTDVLGLNASQVRLNTEPQFPGINPQTFTPNTANDFRLYKLLYIFPSGLDNLTLFAGTNAETTDAFPAITPFASDTQGAISRFAGYNAAVRVSGGTSGTGLASAFGLIWTPSPVVDFRALYGSVNAALPQNNPLTGESLASGDVTPLGAGLFNGSSVAAAQLTLSPSSNFELGINYAHSYHQINILGTGLTSADIGSVLFNPASRCDTVGFGAAAGGFGCSATDGGDFDRGATLVTIGSEPIRMNSIGASMSWRLTDKLTFAASGAYIFADLVNVNASTDFSSWMVGLHAQDIFGESNTAGLIFGKPLSRVSTGGEALDRFENATPLHLEGYLSFQVNDHINITPGVFVLFNPEGYSGNNTVTTGVLRTSFTF